MRRTLNHSPKKTFLRDWSTTPNSITNLYGHYLEGKKGKEWVTYTIWNEKGKRMSYNDLMNDNMQYSHKAKVSNCTTSFATIVYNT